MLFISKIICKKCNSECIANIKKQEVDVYCEKCNDIPVGFDDISFVIDYLSEKLINEDGYEYWSD